ncbi:MAG: tRNA (adenosine(37)-N6)-threonylcarbamoyltransferase complex ATPase subunit type 1 TsaE [Actinobacteria bacterium]|nr:tRNA (adenosine(37)-N6)-threonylcarbamoyltransferase complex ATPase subunit type 1 TsaE [Actinomycetota bacterium]
MPEDRPARITLRSGGPDDTRALAAALASLLRPGDVVSLSGELGAGKTCFVQGAAQALGVTERVTSPTFMLVKSYAGDLPVVHGDVYRLDRVRDVEDLGDELLAADVVTFLEWGDAVRSFLPPDRLEVELLLDDPEDIDADRVLHLEVHGTWAARAADLATALAPWVGPTAHAC